MNILLLTSEYPYEKYPRSDWTWVVPYFCREWKKKGNCVVVINNTSRFPKVYYMVASVFRKPIEFIYDISENNFGEDIWSKPFDFNDDGVYVFNRPMFKLWPGGEFTEKVVNKQIEQICGIINNLRFVPDVITGHWLNPQLRLLCGLKKYYPKARTALVFHGDYSKSNCKKHNANKFISEINHIGCRSKTACDEIKEYLNVGESFICASGIPTCYLLEERPDNYKRFKIEEPMSIISAGRLVRYKNFDKIIKACHISFPDKNFKLKLVGNGPLETSINALVEKYSFKNQVSLIGKVEREKLIYLMDESQVFVLISDRETFGLVYLEAMARGCIVVASKRGGVDGIIEHGINGFLCNQGDELELAEIMKTISRMSIDDKIRISENARLTASDYTDEKVAQRYLEIISR